jgi:hypothetical protein
MFGYNSGFVVLPCELMYFVLMYCEILRNISSASLLLTISTPAELKCRFATREKVVFSFHVTNMTWALQHMCLL